MILVSAVGKMESFICIPDFDGMYSSNNSFNHTLLEL